MIVRVAPEEFQRILDRHKDPLVVHAMGGLFRKNYQYLVGYKGLAFYTTSPEPLNLPGPAEVVLARSIWTP